MTKKVCARLAILVGLVCVTAAACGEAPPIGGPDRIPIGEGSNTGSSSNSTGATVTSISGEVKDTAFRLIAGARLEVVDGSRAGLSTTTDSAGRFVLNGPFGSPTTVRASREGYQARTITWTCPQNVCNNLPPVLSFVLASATPSADLTGNYTVTVSADLACVDLPPAARNRTFAAAIALYEGVNWNYRAELTGATFHPNDVFYPFQDAFDARVAADHVVLDLDFFGMPAVVEQVAPNTYVAFSGEATATLIPGSSSITATLNGFVEFCTTRSPMEPGYVRCGEDLGSGPQPDQIVTHARCESKNHRIVLTRRP